MRVRITNVTGPAKGVRLGVIVGVKLGVKVIVGVGVSVGVGVEVKVMVEVGAFTISSIDHVKSWVTFCALSVKVFDPTLKAL
jgi:hypothetical protein